MQKLRPYVLPGLFVFHLVVLYVLLTTVPTEKRQSPRCLLSSLLCHSVC